MTIDAHAGAEPHLRSMTVSGDIDTFPSHAEQIRTLLAIGRFATLTTVTTAGHVQVGYPYASLVAYSVLDDGSPLLCISELAEHTRNAQADSRAGMLLTGLPVDEAADPLDRPRASLVGRLRRYEPSSAARAAHVELHPGMAVYVDFPDFNWWHFEIAAARYVGGFGHMSWVSGDEIAATTPDVVAIESQPAIAHMNADHPDACLDMTRWLADIREAVAARVHSIDRHGITLYATRPGSSALATARVAFPAGPLASAADLRPAVVELTQRARRLAKAAS